MPLKKKKKIKNKNGRPRKAIARGRGGYWQDFQNWTKGSGKPLMEGASRALGSTFGWGAEYISRAARVILGLGEYKLDRGIQASPVPMMHSSADKGVRLCHYEYLGDVVSSTAYTNTRYAINVGLGAAFPWLSTMAGSFQYYKFNGLMFVFRSTSAVALNSTNTALGVVMGCAQYNVMQPSPPDKISFVNLAGASSAPPCSSQMFPIECEKMLTSVNALKVRTNDPSDDLQFYDLANFNIATYGSQAAAVVGELWVTYDVELMHTQPAVLTNTNMSAHYYASGTVSNTAFFGTSNVSKFDSIGLTFLPTGGPYTTIVIPPGIGGKWQLTYHVYGTTQVIANPTVVHTNCTSVGIWNGTSQSVYGPVVGVNSVIYLYSTVLSITDPTKEAKFSFTSGTGLIPTNANMDLLLTEANATLLATPKLIGTLEGECEEKEEYFDSPPTPAISVKSMRRV